MRKVISHKQQQLCLLNNNAQKIRSQEKSEEQYDLKEVETFYLTNLQGRDMELSVKLLEQKLKECQATKIILKMKINFDNDQVASMFSTRFTKLAKYPIKYMEWNAEGNFMNESQAKCLGKIISNYTGLYSLTLSICKSHFGDKAAKHLSKGISMLINLHKLKVFIISLFGIQDQQMTRAGNHTILKSIFSLPNLEILDHNFFYTKEYPFPKLLASLREPQQYGTAQLLDEKNGGKNAYFERQIHYLQERKEIITQILIEYQEDFFWNFPVSYKDYLMMYLELPYLTKFCVNFKAEEKATSTILQYNALIARLANSKLNRIHMILAFNINIKGYMLFNPLLLLLDLFM